MNISVEGAALVLLMKQQKGLGELSFGRSRRAGLLIMLLAVTVRAGVEDDIGGWWWCEIGQDYGRLVIRFDYRVITYESGEVVTNTSIRGLGTVAASVYPQSFSGSWGPLSDNAIQGNMQWIGGDIGTPQGYFTAALTSTNDLVISTGGPVCTCIRANAPAPNLAGKWSFKGSTAEGKVKGKLITDPHYNQPYEYPYVYDGWTKDRTYVYLFCGPDQTLWMLGVYQNNLRFRGDGAFTAPGLVLEGFTAEGLPLTVQGKFKPAKAP